MKTRVWVAAAAVAMTAVTGSIVAANISNVSGQSCGDFSGNWHFVNNQTDGAAGGQLYATWDSGDVCLVEASKVNRNTQHFDCVASGELLTAYTNLPGRLVLSDFSCDAKEPPPCDPKDPKCEPPK